MAFSILFPWNVLNPLLDSFESSSPFGTKFGSC